MRGAKNKIAVVANDVDTRLLLSTLLRKQGFEISEYSDATAILNRAISLPDVFIVDNDLPHVDGLALCKFVRVQKESSGIPVILLSPYPMERRALKAGANAFIQKPIELYSLLEAITNKFDSVAH